jgi:hypothetical protein
LRVDDARFFESIPAVTTELHFWLPFQIIMRPHKQIAALGACASWVQARVLDIVAVSSRPFVARAAARREQVVRPVSYVSRFSPKNYSYCPAIITAQRGKKP